MNENKINEALDIISASLSMESGEAEQDIMKILGTFLSMPDEVFDTISEGFLLALEKSMNDSNNINSYLAALKEKEISVDYLVANKEEMDKEFDKMIGEEEGQYPANKVNFLKRVMGIIINSISRFSGMADEYIVMPIEICYEEAKIPTYANPSDSGMDVYALEDITLAPGERKIIKTGLKVAIPIGYELQVRPKSGLSSKTSLRIANTPGTIDAGYRDEIGIIIENIESKITDIDYDFDEDTHKIFIKSIEHGKDYTIVKGQKFAQLVLCKVPKCGFYQVDNIKEFGEDRGGGFGSTGLF